MARSQNSPRIVLAVKKLFIGPQSFTGDSTGVKFEQTVSALPGDVTGGERLAIVKNSTGQRALALCSSGTSWTYFSFTSVFPT